MASQWQGRKAAFRDAGQPVIFLPVCCFIHLNDDDG